MISELVSPGSSQIPYFRRITLKRFHMTQRFLCTCQRAKVASHNNMASGWSSFSFSESVSLLWILISTHIHCVPFYDFQSFYFNWVKQIQPCEDSDWKLFEAGVCEISKIKGIIYSAHAFLLHHPSKLVWIRCIYFLLLNILYTLQQLTRTTLYWLFFIINLLSYNCNRSEKHGQNNTS